MAKKKKAVEANEIELVDKKKNIADDDAKSDDTDKDSDEKKKEEDKAKPPAVAFYRLFRFADWIDGLMIFIGVFCAIAQGACMPLINVVFGEIIDASAGLASLISNKYWALE